MKQQVIEIIKKHIIDNGFDGLHNERYECACELSNLRPCESDISECVPGYKHPGDEDYEFYILDTK